MTRILQSKMVMVRLTGFPCERPSLEQSLLGFPGGVCVNPLPPGAEFLQLGLDIRNHVAREKFYIFLFVIVFYR